MSRDVLQRALVIREKEYGRRHVETATTLENIAACLYHKARLQYSNEPLEVDMIIYHEVLSIIVEKHGYDSVDTARILRKKKIKYGASYGKVSAVPCY